MYLSMAKRIMNRIGNKGKRVNLLVMSCEVIPDAFGEATGCVRFERSSREYPPTIGPTDAEPPPSPRSAASRNVLAVTGSLAAAWSPSSNLCFELAENRPGFCRGTATRLPVACPTIPVARSLGCYDEPACHYVITSDAYQHGHGFDDLHRVPS